MRRTTRPCRVALLLRLLPTPHPHHEPVCRQTFATARCTVKDVGVLVTSRSGRDRQRGRGAARARRRATSPLRPRRPAIPVSRDEAGFSTARVAFWAAANFAAVGSPSTTARFCRTHSRSLVERRDHAVTSALLTRDGSLNRLGGLRLAIKGPGVDRHEVPSARG